MFVVFVLLQMKTFCAQSDLYIFQIICFYNTTRFDATSKAKAIQQPYNHKLDLKWGRWIICQQLFLFWLYWLS